MQNSQAQGGYSPQSSYPPSSYGQQPQQPYSYPPAQQPYQQQGQPYQQQGYPGYQQPQAAPQPAMAPARPKRSFMSFLPAILVIVGVVLAGVALGTGWWAESGSGTIEGYSESYSGSVNLFGCSSYTETVNGASSSSSSCSTTNNSAVTTVFDVTLGMVIGGLILGIIGVVFAFLGMFSRRPMGKTMSMLPFLVTLIAAVLMIAAPMYFMAALPGAECNGGSNCPSFFGSQTVSGISESYGGGIGWYLAIGAFVVFLIAAIFMLMAWRKAKASAPPADQMMMQQQAQPGMQPMMQQQPQQASWGAQPAAQPAQPAAAPYSQPAPAYAASPAPAAYQAPQPAYQQPAQQAGMTCPSCGRPASFIAQYNRYYCNSCQKYV